MNESMRPRKQYGFMLLEALIAIAIFSFGVLAIVGLQAISIKQVNEAKYRTQASFLANEVIGQLWAERSAVVVGYQAPPTWVARVAGALPSGDGNIVVSANQTIKASTQYVVTVTVSWQSPGGDAHKYVSVAQINGASVGEL